MREAEGGLGVGRDRKMEGRDERRRVAWGGQVLLLDEITVDLDVLGRADLLNFLAQECEQRGATIIYVGPPAHHPPAENFRHWNSLSFKYHLAVL